MAYMEKKETKLFGASGAFRRRRLLFGQYDWLLTELIMSREFKMMNIYSAWAA